MLDIPVLEQKIRDGMSAAFVPGLAVAVIHDNRLIYQNGFGVTSVEDPRPVTPETLFRIGSITKPLTATLIMRMVEQNRLNLNVGVERYLDWLKIGRRYRAEKTITLRMLLSHTAGIFNNLEYYRYRRSLNKDAHIFGTKETLFPPGTAYQYSNPGINLAGLVAEHEGALPFPNLMYREVFAPLNMHRTTFDPMEAMTYSLALPHLIRDDNTLYVMRPFIENTAMHPCGFAISNVVEMANFALMHLNEGRFNGEQFLTSASIHEMHTPVVERMTLDNSGYGLCFRSYDCRGVQLVGHNGAIGKYGGWFWLHRHTKTAVIMLVNRAPQFWGYAANIVHGVFEELLELKASPMPAASFHLESSDFFPGLEAVAGDFLGSDTGLVQFSVVKDVLQVQQNFGEVLPLHLIRENVFASHDRSVTIGVINPSMIYYNGNLCQRFNYEPFPRTIPPEVAGMYEHDIDTFTVRIENNTLYVHSRDDRTEYACLPVEPQMFVGAIGTLEFREEGLLWQNAFQFRPVLP
jgi:CubicO group peptidase (beta-lactamase class C family)